MSRPYTDNLKLCLRIMRDARPQWQHLAGIFLLEFLSTPLVLLTPFPMKIAVDSVLANKPLPAFFDSFFSISAQPSTQTILLLACLLSFSIMLLQAAFSYGSWVYQLYTGERLVLDCRARMFWHTQRLSLKHHDEKGSSDLLYRLNSDVYHMQHLAIYGLIPLCTSTMMFVTMFIITVRLDWQLALISIAVLPVLYCIHSFHLEKSRASWALVKESEGKAIGVIQEALNCIRVVKAFNKEEQEADKFRDKAQNNLGRYMSAIKNETIFGMLVSGTIALASASALYVGVGHVQSGLLSLGNFLVVMSYLAQLFKPIETFSKQISSTQSSLASAERVFALADEVPDIQDVENARVLGRAEGLIEFRHVNFNYRQDQAGLSDISFKIKPGMKVGIIGATGAGKTTLINLLMRFFDPSSGTITLDGIDLRQIRVADLRNQFAFVLQDPVLFSISILENIKYGRNNASMEEVIEAAKAAGAHDFIQSLPDGYGTQVGDKGMGLSGGERQRVSIARAFLTNAPILVMDEPTSAVDQEKEAAIAQALQRLQVGRTTFTISHRLSFIEGYDIVMKLEHGHLLNTPMADAI